MPKKTIEARRPKKSKALKPARFLDPKSDLVFKKIFGEKKELTISFLNSILPLPEGHLIQTISYLPSEQTPRIPVMKNTIVDVKCTDESGRIFIVEMQFNWSTHFMERMLFGVSKAYVQQLPKGEEYDSLCPVYGLGIINQNFDASEEWFHHYKTVNIKNPSKVLPGLELIFIELQKFKPQTFEHRKMGVLWLRFLKEIDETVVDVPQEFLDNPLVNQALEIAQESGYSAAELDSYDKYWDAVRVEKTIARDAREIGREEGKEIGREEGKEIGREEGKEIGKEIGREENRRELARNMLLEGFEISLIAKMTHLSLEALKELKNLNL